MSDGNGHHDILLIFDHPPRRVVSLVPSLTESMFELGLGFALVGITDYCAYPAEALVHLPRLGGTKNPRLEDILALQPDLVLANQEENTPQVVEALRQAGIPVWVTFPRTVDEAMQVLWELVRIYPSQGAVVRLRVLNLTLDWAREALEAMQPVRYFCPIWHEQTQAGQAWWMTFNRQTYAHDLLRLCGGENVFGDRERRYPLEADLGGELAQASGGRDTRYPRVTLEEIIAADPQVILLPSEPYPFGEDHCQALAELLGQTQAARDGAIYLVDGSLITWHGTRLARGLRELGAYFQQPAPGEDELPGK